MALEQLPEEILRIVVGQLDRDYSTKEFKYTSAKPTLYALCLTSHSLSRIATRFLFEEVRLPISDGGEVLDSGPPKSVQAFITSCQHGSCALAYTKKLSYRWRLENGISQLMTLLKTLAPSTNLSYLSLDLGTAPITHETLLAWLCPFVQSFNNLETLYLRLQVTYDYPSAEFLLQLCRIGRLRNLALSCRLGECEDQYWLDHLSRNSDTWHAQVTDEWETRIECVDLHNHDWGPYLSQDALLILLPHSPYLRVLKMGLTRPGVTSAWMQDPIEGKDVLSPAALGRLLLPVENSLQELCIFDDLNLIHWHDGSLIDLSNMNNLRYLEISIHLLCVSSLSDATKVPSQDFWKLLPRHLRTLFIGFESEKGVIWDIDELEGLQGSRSTEDTDSYIPWHGKDVAAEFNELWNEHLSDASLAKEKVKWLREVVEETPENLADLTEFTVQQTARWEDNPSWGWVDLMQGFPGLFNVSQGLSFKLLLVVPTVWKPSNTVCGAGVISSFRSSG